ncbi:MAG: DUF6089 family protein [Ferruginibacter sp.]
MVTVKSTCPVFFSILFLISHDGFTQKPGLRKWEAGLHAGAYVYQGDLTPNRYGSFETLRPGIGFFGTRIMNPVFSVRLLFNLAALAGNESVYKYPEWRQQRNFAFTASVKELTLLLHYNIRGSNYIERKYEPYVFAGGGVSAVNITRDYSRYNASYFGEQSDLHGRLAADAVTPTPKIVPIVPVGAGIRYNLSEKIAINLEGSYRFMHTDYLDGFSIAANPGFKDHYSSLTIGAAYKFGGKEKYGCPSVN